MQGVVSLQLLSFQLEHRIPEDLGIENKYIEKERHLKLGSQHSLMTCISNDETDIVGLRKIDRRSHIGTR
jgi:hypothetical protein